MNDFYITTSNHNHLLAWECPNQNPQEGGPSLRNRKRERCGEELLWIEKKRG
jgi:hypothetical protein